MGVHSASKRGLIGLIWQILLFVVSTIMLCGVFPYQLYNRNFMLSYILVGIFWLLVWIHAYRKLFPKKDVATIEQPEISPSCGSSSHSAAELKTMEISQPDDKEEINRNHIPPRVSDTFEKPMQREGDKVNMYCSKCGNKHAETSSFCSSCGNQLSERSD
jgi:hypothetical protein